MEDLFKKVFYTGVGLVTNTTNSLKNGVNELVEKGKISEEEGKKVVSGVEETIETKREEFEAIMNNAVGIAMAKLNFPSSENINRLEKRIKSLEIKVGLLTKELEQKTETAKKAAPKKATAKKTTTRKTTSRAKASAK